MFNCSDQMDYKGMGKIYRGLAQSGLWGCFDEFNRINLDVLSVCAQQVFCVLSAIRERKTEFIFTDGAKVSLDPRKAGFLHHEPRLRRAPGAPREFEIPVPRRDHDGP